MKRLILLTVALISMLLATQAATISFSTPNKPATWALDFGGFNISERLTLLKPL